MAHHGFAFFGKVSHKISAWVVFAWVWLAHLLVLATMIGFRAIKTSGIAQTFEFEDVPVLQLLDIHYPDLMLGMVLSGAVLGLALLLSGLAARAEGRVFPVGLLGQFGSLFGLGIFACRFFQPEPGLGVDVESIGFLDWFLVLLGCSTSWTLLKWITAETHREADPEFHEAASSQWGSFTRPAESRVVRLSVIYLLGCFSVAIFAFYKHYNYWIPENSRGYDYRPYYLPGEIEQANWLFYSTSLLFATLAALGGCAAYWGLRFLSKTERAKSVFLTLKDVRLQAAALAVFWTATLTVPWEIKILPEIISNEGWILPTVSLWLSTAGLMPLLLANGLLLRKDYERSAQKAVQTGRTPVIPKRSEFAFWNLLLFPIYPILRAMDTEKTPARARSFGLMLLTAGTIGILMWVFQKADDLFDFDDWRGMLQSGLFPCLQVVMSLLAAGWVYLVGSQILAIFQRRNADRSETPSVNHPVGRLFGGLTRLGIITIAAGTLSLASWPFWGWHQISENVFARGVEFHKRHEFELRFLHWIFDADRDGYAAVLHGPDADDSDPNIQAAGILAGQVVPVPIDEFEIVDEEKAKKFPNVAIFYLEGVIPHAISAYGKRRLPDGLVATPHMDSIAREGTRFNQARCFYPSTWDGWLAVNCGRFLRTSEMHAGKGFGDRYSRYNNLYKVLKLAGINRWCHADTSPYVKLFVPEDMKSQPATNWKTWPDFDSSVNEEDEERGLWRGDKRADRIVEFIDSLKPGERFFFCEHMADTHFPWERTPDQRAKELGFPNGLGVYEKDDTLPSGGKYEKYSCYLQTITRMDAQIGLILNKLKEKNLYDNTIVVIVSDHGCQWFEHEHMYYVRHLYDQSLIVPMIIKAPGLPGGMVTDEPVLQIDIMPTLADLAGIRQANPNPDYPLTCQSLVPLMTKDSPVDPKRYRHRDMILCNHYGTLGVVSHFEHKLIYDRPTGTMLVFDLKNDPEEMINIADSQPKVREMLFEKLRFLTKRHPSFIGEIEASKKN